MPERDVRRHVWAMVIDIRRPSRFWEIGVAPGPAGEVQCWTNPHSDAVPLPPDLARALAAFIASVDDVPFPDESSGI